MHTHYSLAGCHSLQRPGHLIRHQLSLTQSTQACTLCRIIMKTERVLKALLGAKMNPGGIMQSAERHRANQSRARGEGQSLQRRRHVASKVLCATLWPFALKHASHDQCSLVQSTERN